MVVGFAALSAQTRNLAVVNRVQKKPDARSLVLVSRRAERWQGGRREDKKKNLEPLGCPTLAGSAEGSSPFLSSAAPEGP